MRIPLLAALIALPLMAAPALADSVTGIILAYDRQANIIFFNDKSVWELGELLVPGDLVAGDRVKLDYTGAGDNRIGEVTALTREA